MNIHRFSNKVKITNTRVGQSPFYSAYLANFHVAIISQTRLRNFLPQTNFL